MALRRILQQALLAIFALQIEPMPEYSEDLSHFEFCRVMINEARGRWSKETCNKIRSTQGKQAIQVKFEG